MGQLTEIGQDIGAFISTITPGAVVIILVFLIVILIVGAVGTAGTIMVKIFGGKNK